MLSLISFILVCIGSINWFCIGILQFDFVAGIFGSQSNIFSRLIYTLIGVASLIVLFNFITNKGKFVVSLKKANKEYSEYKEEKKEENMKRKKATATESADEFSLERKMTNTEQNNNDYRRKLESAKDNALTRKMDNSNSSNHDYERQLESAEDNALQHTSESLKDNNMPE